MGLQCVSPLLVSCHQAQRLVHPTPHKNYTHTLVSAASVPCPESPFVQTSLLPMSYQKPSNTGPQPSPSPPLFASSKKRSPQVAFSGETPPSSRPPSRAHTQKRLRAKRAAERPSWVSKKDESIELDARVEGVLIDVLWPGAGSLECGIRLGNLGNSRRGFTVLCFLGCTIEHLQGLRFKAFSTAYSNMSSLNLGS